MHKIKSGRQAIKEGEELLVKKGTSPTHRNLRFAQDRNTKKNGKDDKEREDKETN